MRIVIVHVPLAAMVPLLRRTHVCPAVAAPQVTPSALVCTVPAPQPEVVAVGVGAMERFVGSWSLKVTLVIDDPVTTLVTTKVAVEYVAGVPVAGIVVG